MNKNNEQGTKKGFLSGVDQNTCPLIDTLRPYLYPKEVPLKPERVVEKGPQDISLVPHYHSGRWTENNKIFLDEHKVIPPKQQFLGIVLSFFMHLK